MNRSGLCIVATALSALSCGEPSRPVAVSPGALRPAAAHTSPGAGAARAFYVSPDGRADGHGTRGRPWDLATALAGAGGMVGPGDRVWLLGGTYRGTFTSTLVGEPEDPIVVRQFPGERATIDGRLVVRGADVTFWGFELTQTDRTSVPNQPAIETYAPGERLVNLVIHDTRRSGVLFGRGPGTSEMYGCIVYNNGTVEELDHGIYVNNDGGEKRVVDNVVFNNLAYGIHAFVDLSHPVLTNLHIEGNASFNNGTISASGPAFSNLFVGAEPTTQQIAAVGNLLYYSGLEGQNLRLGFADRDNRDVVARDNYVAGGQTVLRLEDWHSAVIEDNTFIGQRRMVRLGGPLSGYRWSGNTYHRDPAASAWNYGGTLHDFATFLLTTGLGATDRTLADLPRETRVFVRPNRYESGRAHIVVYNWSRRPDVPVDVSDILRRGDHYVVHNVQDVFGTPVASGVYRGAPIRVPLTGVEPPRATGRPGTPPRTGPDFDVFLLATSRGPSQGRCASGSALC